MKGLKFFSLPLLWILMIAPFSCANDKVGLAMDGSTERLFMATKNTTYNPFTGTGGLKNYFLVLLPDGTAYRGIPKESTLGFLNRQQLIQENKLRVGDYVENGNTLTITWTYYQQKVSTYTREGNSWRENASKVYNFIQPIKSQNSLSGTYVFEHVSGTAPFPGLPSTTLGVKDVITFQSNGTFTRHIQSGASSGSSVGANSKTINGTYQIKDYALTLKSNNGTTHTLTLFKWPKEENTVLALNGKRFLKTNS